MASVQDPPELEMDESDLDEQPEENQPETPPISPLLSKSQTPGSHNYPNGIVHDIYKTLPSSERQKLNQCQYCTKYYNKGLPDNKTMTYKGGMISSDYDQSGEPVCFHCIYMLNYNPIDARMNFDGAFGKTVVEFIMECKDSHDKEACAHSTECFICDYLNGKPIEGILGADELFAGNEAVRDEDDKVVAKPDESFSFNICI